MWAVLRLLCWLLHALGQECLSLGVFATLCEWLTIQRVLLDSTLGLDFLCVTILFFNFFLLLVLA